MGEFLGTNGVAITDEMLDTWAERYEQGDYPGTAGEQIVRKQFGRPRLFDEPMVAKTIRLRADQSVQLAELARAGKKNSSALMREAWDEYVARHQDIAA